MQSIRRQVWLAFALGLTAGSLHAQEPPVIEIPNIPLVFEPSRKGPDCPPGTVPPVWPPAPRPVDPGAPAPVPGAQVPADANIMDQAPSSNVAETAGLTPTMFGDSLQSSHSSSPSRNPSNFAGVYAAYGAKIADNSSPAVLDRVYLGYNCYSNVGGLGISGNVETIGFEKSFLDGNASFGMRMPFVQFAGGSSSSVSSGGDLTFTGKWAFFNDPTTGDVLSAGLSLTIPTGPSVAVPGFRNIDPTFFQPFVGLLMNSGDAFVHGFSSIIVPTDPRDVTLWFNDIGVGYWLFRDDTDTLLLRAIVPTFEVHINTPLDHRYPGAATQTDSIVFADDVNLTIGATFFLRGGSSLGAAFAVPVTGPKPFNGEAIVQFNVRF